MTVFYKKQGKRYVAVSEYDADLCNSFPYGTHVVVCQPNSMSRRFQVDPNLAPMIGAARYAESAMTDALQKASMLRPARAPLTPEQWEKWNEFKKSMGDDVYYINYPSAADIVRAGLDAMQEEADKQLTNPAVKKAWDYFMTISRLAKEYE